MHLVDNFKLSFFVGKYNSIGRVSICDIGSYRFESYYLPIQRFVNTNITIKHSKYKNIRNLKVLLKKLEDNILYLRKTIIFFKKFIFKKFTYKNKSIFKQSLLKYNIFILFNKNKATIHDLYNSSTWSIGMLLVLVGIYYGNKFIRRASKGYRILINFLKVKQIKRSSHFFKKMKNSYIIFYFKNINNNFFLLKKKIFKIFFFFKIHFFLTNTGLSFSKFTGKKLKAIKKRIKKKLILNHVNNFRSFI